METLKCWRSLHRSIVVFMLLATVNTGSTCEAPSSPQCFRRNADTVMYTCEWTMNTTESNVVYYISFRDPLKDTFLTRSPGINTTTYEILGDILIKDRPIDVWVEAHVGNLSCSSTWTSVILRQQVKYVAPQNIKMSWLKNNLRLSWPAAEKHPALAEVSFRRCEHPSESEETRMINTSWESSSYSVTVVNLLRLTAYEVQIRQRSNWAGNPVWSDRSPVVTVPSELGQEPEVNFIINSPRPGSRVVTLTWKPMSNAAGVTGVEVTDTQSSEGCPCPGKTKDHPIRSNKRSVYVSYSAANISIIMTNAAGSSPPAVIQVPAQPADNLLPCDKTLLNEKLNNTTCLQFYELQDDDNLYPNPRPENVITLKKRKKQMKQTIKNFVRYLYFEHGCHNGNPRTVKMCLFYKTEAAPLVKPQGFTPFSETHDSVDVSWKAIPSVDQRGFLTHYSLCSVSVDEPEVCRNISASETKHRLENLTPGTKYNISLAGVTRGGEGPRATLTINTLPEKEANVLWSLSLLFVFFFISTTCTCILKRIKNKILPPVPTPVIPNFTSHQAESQEMLERKEEVHELTLLELHPERKSIPKDAEETTVFGGQWDDGADEDGDNQRSNSSMSGGSGDERLDPGSTDRALRKTREEETTELEQLDNEIAMLIYRNGLVFDVKTD